jgi:hypothetical protein
MIPNGKATALIEKIKKEAAKHNVLVQITKSNSIYAKDGSNRCQALFIPPINKHCGYIRVAAGSCTLAEILLAISHEYIHMRQYLNEESIYFQNDYYKLEKNTELRAISFMKRNGLSKKILAQAKKHSNAYLNELASELIIK